MKRKDLIMRYTRKPPKMKITDINRIYTSRPHDFKEHPEIFDFKNEYSTTFSSTHILCDFKQVENFLPKTKTFHEPTNYVTLNNEPTAHQIERGKRQLVNVGFDNNESYNIDTFPLELDTYCHEELSPSVVSDDDENISEIQEDPFAVSDDSKDEDYIPEGLDKALFDRESETLTMIQEKSCTVNVSFQQLCEFESIEKCTCLLCLDHYNDLVFNQQISKSLPYSSKKEGNKENNCNSINLQISKKYKPKNCKSNDFFQKNASTENILDDIRKSSCDYIGCAEEVFSTCGQCLCFLCFDHFTNDVNYNDCEKHNKYLQQEKSIKNPKERGKGNQGKDCKVFINKNRDILSQKAKEMPKKRDDFKKTLEVQQGGGRIKKTTPHGRRNSLDSLKTNTSFPVTALLCKRRNTIEIGAIRTLIVNDELLSQRELEIQSIEAIEPSRKRKKRELSRLRRKTNAKNKRILEHSVKEPCSDKCLKKCTSHFNVTDRLAINATYWSMSWEEQHAFIRAHSSAATPKRKYSIEPKRNPRRVFTLKKIDDIRIEVCKIFLLTTLGYEKTNDRILHNSFSDMSIDKRGKHQKTPAFDRNLLAEHIESFDPQAPHYRRAHAPLRRYLPSDLSISSMHKHFCEKYPDKKVSYELYRQQIKHMNISFARLGNEECETCESYNLHKSGTSHDAKTQIVENCNVCVEWAKHHENYKKARELYQKHKELTPSETDKYYSADLEKVIMLPRLDMFKVAIFCRRLVVFNETFAPLGKISAESKPLTVLWHDGIAGRKQNDIMSAYYHFLLYNRDITRLHVWLDNCSAQNKNWLLYCLFIHLINSDIILTEQIILYYFEPGHTFMSCDQVHHQIELAMKKKNKLFDFIDFEETVASINNSKVNVKSMATEDFFNIQNYISERRVQKSKPRAYLKDMVQVCFTRNSFDLKYKNDFDGEYTELRFLNDKYLKNPNIMKLEFQTEPKGIELDRKNEILKTFSKLIPNHKLLFWKNLTTKNSAHEKPKKN